MVKSLLFNIFFAATAIFWVDSYGAQCTLSITDIQESNAISCNSVCDGELTVSFSGEAGTASFQWFDANNTDLGINNAIATGLCAGSYSVFITDGNNCTTDTTFTITEPATITATVTRVNTTCATSVGELDITGAGGCGGPYQYSIDGGATFQAPGTFTGLATGFYSVVVQDNCGCSQSFTEYISTTDGPTIISLNFTNSLCNGGNNGSITIFSTGTLPITYSIDGGATFSGNNVYTNLAPGGYSIVVEDGGGCQSLGYVTISEPNAMSVSPITINETCILNNGSIDLQTAGGASPIQYSIDNGVTFQPISSFTGLVGGTYDYVVEDNNACQTTGQITLTTGAGPTISSSTSLDPTCDNVCNGVISVAATGNNPSYSLNAGANQTTGDYSGLCTGAYTIDISDDDGCTTSQNFTLTAPTPPVAGFSVSDTSGLAPLTVDFTNTSTGATSYYWDFGDTVSTSTLTDPQFIFSDEGTYTVMMVASELQCTDTAYQIIEILGTPNVTMPNIFTPNGDGVNDLFRPIAVGASEITGQIYNRYGELIYEWWGTNGYWDGYTRPAGQLVPAGTYFYIVTATDISGGTYELTGPVQLMR